MGEFVLFKIEKNNKTNFAECTKIEQNITIEQIKKQNIEMSRNIILYILTNYLFYAINICSPDHASGRYMSYIDPNDGECIVDFPTSGSLQIPVNGLPYTFDYYIETSW